MMAMAEFGADGCTRARRSRAVRAAGRMATRPLLRPRGSAPSEPGRGPSATDRRSARGGRLRANER